ncbi:MAG: transporter [Phycisphaeraceae bacterium]|nr:transporter [Phycisphaerales bacterium]QOJ17442.1 MAG: transporter [Phycisphaeraceae bacterium]
MRGSAGAAWIMGSCGVAWSLSGALASSGQEASYRDLGTSSYSLFNPTPRELRRGMSPDRPDTTESPITVDAGVVQLEMSFFDLSKNGSHRTWTAAPFNLKLGLTESMDIQFVLDPYLHVREDGRGRLAHGLGDLQVRLKLNLWGNDGGSTAFGVMPFIKVPTAGAGLGNDHVEGGVILALSWDAAPGVGLAFMVEPDIVYDEADDDHDLELLHTAVLGLDITDRVGWFIEYAGVVSADASPYRAEAITGFTLAVTDDLMLDCGVRLGLTGDADDWGLFAGMSIRF